MSDEDMGDAVLEEKLELLLTKLQLNVTTTMKHVISDHLQPQAVKMADGEFDLDDFIEEMITAVHELNICVEASVSVQRYRMIHSREVPVVVMDLNKLVGEIKDMSEEELKEAIGDKMASFLNGNDVPDDIPTGQYL